MTYVACIQLGIQLSNDFSYSSTLICSLPLLVLNGTVIFTTPRLAKIDIAYYVLSRFRDSCPQP